VAAHTTPPNPPQTLAERDALEREDEEAAEAESVRAAQRKVRGASLSDCWSGL